MGLEQRHAVRTSRSCRSRRRLRCSSTRPNTASIAGPRSPNSRYRACGRRSCSSSAARRRALSLELFLDGTDKRASNRPGDTSRADRRARKFVTIDPELHAPPVCLFQWRQMQFYGVVTSFKEKYQLFDESGKVLRARVTLSIKSYEAVEVQLREMRLKSPIARACASSAKGRRWPPFRPRSTATRGCGA